MSISFLSDFTDIEKQIVIESVQKILQQNAREDADVNVSIVGHKVVTELAKEYLNESDEEAKDHPVLSFVNAEIESEFIFPPDSKNIGDIVVSHDMAKKEAEKKGTSISQEAAELAAHGALHLLEIHHA